MTPFTGGCACRAIRYEIATEPLMSGHCQCRDCQHMTGTGHASMMAFPAAAVRMTGTPKFHDSKSDSGNIASRGFCATCGSFVVARSSGMAGLVTIAAGSLDDPSRYAPQLLVFTKSGPAWDLIDPALPRFEGMPPPQGMPAAG
jgi:hypothetical protein